ncbi:hypothetical protein GQ53DRAFT_788736 [Thozetella sp. PMI_491]|nr:hypothetical protein GQ53DRAFT_788736 [Thozetella sp. PMI_491]
MDPKEQFYPDKEPALQEQIKQLSSFSTVGGERQDAIEHILTGISRLTSEVADAADYVPTYDQRTYTQAIKALTEQLNETTSKLAPRSRFQFKPRATDAPGDLRHDPRGLPGRSGISSSAAPAPASISTQAEQEDEVGELPSLSKDYNKEIARTTSIGIRKPSFSAARNIVLSDHQKLHIILPTSAARATSAGALTNMKSCIVDMSVPTTGGAPFASLALKSIENSLIIAGHVNGPAHITGIKNSIIVVAARQVRIHECENVDVYLHCTSRPIIEDCKGMRFAPTPKTYITEDRELGENQWDQVDDFKWLKTAHSPNWSVLPEEDRLSEDIWRNTVPGGPGVSVDDILRKVGVTLR